MTSSFPLRPQLIYLSALGILIGSSVLSLPSHAATELSDRALRQQTENNHSQMSVPEVLDCPKDMRQTECNRLQYENYANQTDRSYSEFLKMETNKPLRNQVIKQPLLTQPLENPRKAAEPPANPGNLLNPLKSLPNNLPNSLP